MSEQRDIFEVVERQPGYDPAAFPELCTALYERELIFLAGLQVQSARGLQRRLKSLSYYIQNAARAMLSSQCPCELDVQNASWQTPQKRQLKATANRSAKLEKWLTTGKVQLGTTVPVLNLDPRLQQVRLDSIDRIDRDTGRVHCNEFGWFLFTGESTAADGDHLFLAKPEKNLLKAAVSGHQWSHKGRTDPRTLSLRELLLATAIDWS
ncbi:hypothetical protein [Pseudidiomarina terrestris]|uniref:DUF2913 domain-containing protein n=1 Tax=Pseudidiomarina terrestris TaxID=2820060 RepID=A0AAW7QX03_9GAMM|nr:MULTISPECIES: hypothetical protein [unclassified Pseudidiomarina]MDN7123594.1 hypothetical protein [Pseudidiomarina sp. 1APP75-32.1]MDN7126616.1 hypothetical protein [Pseudidiomarina sp. 1APR75-33.1]MDN7128682.1 hypothetical protein [Pseudidiomarina sp. 1APR75-15]MDN7135059.1 hypothetical protein [Pseudidiomarina sp. 1ASP75-5]MDN7137730.1 hypothetical protein [Pseudidiomarina sp. 1ASP75-14]